ncbi:MAG: hypothetical protein R2725_03830 [Solirubrobacterales bacterium]
MRKRSLVVGLAVAAFVAIVASVAVAGPVGKPVSSSDGNSQAIGALVKPNKLYKKKLTPTALEVTTALSTATAANGVPIPTTNVQIDLDKNATIYTKGVPTCNAGKLQNVSTEIAERECKKAIVGKGTATALLPVGNQVFTVEQTVTAFNGKPKGKKPVVLLHSYGTTPIQTTLVLTAVVGQYNKQGYGLRLNITVPLIANGAGALTRFNVTINKKYKYKGKRRSYVLAKCPKNKQLKVRSVFKFLDGQTTDPTYKQRCKQKPEKKK